MQVSAWIDAFNNPVINVPQNLKQKDTGVKQIPKVILRHEALPLDSLNIFLLPQYGLVGEWEDKMILLADENLTTISWLNGKSYESVIQCGEQLIGKKDSTLFVIKQEKSEIKAKMNTVLFTLYPHNDNSFLVLSWGGILSTLLVLNTESDTYTEILRQPYDIWKIESNGEKIFLLVENSIFVIDEKGYPRKIYSCEQGINDISLTYYGLLIATDNNIMCMKTDKSIYAFYTEGAKRLWFDTSGLYALNIYNDLWFFENKQ